MDGRRAQGKEASLPVILTRKINAASRRGALRTGSQAWKVESLPPRMATRPEKVPFRASPEAFPVVVLIAIHPGASCCCSYSPSSRFLPVSACNKSPCIRLLATPLLLTLNWYYSHSLPQPVKFPFICGGTCSRPGPRNLSLYSYRRAYCVVRRVTACAVPDVIHWLTNVT
jgi:hypothetical protein